MRRVVFSGRLHKARAVSAGLHSWGHPRYSAVGDYLQDRQAHRENGGGWWQSKSGVGRPWLVARLHLHPLPAVLPKPPQRALGPLHMGGRRAPNRAASATAADLLIQLRTRSSSLPFLVSYRSGCYEGGWEGRGPRATPLGFIPPAGQVLDPAMGRGCALLAGCCPPRECTSTLGSNSPSPSASATATASPPARS